MAKTISISPGVLGAVHGTTPSSPMTPVAPAASRFSAKAVATGALLLALAVVPIIASMVAQPFYLTIVSRMMIFALAALGLNLVLGYGGLVSFGHALYIGIGAYAVGIMATYGVTNGWAQLAMALLVGGAVAAATGWVCLRASGVAFIMITLAFAQMGFFLAISLKQFGGDDGLPLTARSDFGLFSLASNTVLYYTIFVVLLATLYGLHRFVDARFGMVLRGSKSNERRMQAMGFATTRYKLGAYVISALICVMSGMLLTNLTSFTSPSYMQWSVSGELTAMVVLGGIGTLMGPVFGACVWLVLEELLTSFSLGLPDNMDAFVRDHWQGVLGIFVILVTMYFRRGLYGSLLGARR
jgi:branched-chain amino acid transport system permease protein